MITGNAEISVFDNQTGIGPFLTSPTFPHPVPKIPAVSRFFERRRPHDKRNEV